MNKKTDIQLVEQLKQEIEEWKGKYLRALADYQNLEKRIVQERNSQARHAARNLILDLLSVIDILEKASKTLKDEGLYLALKQFKSILKSEGAEEIEVVGKKFDPHLMECIEVVESDRDGEVIDEILQGYTLSGKLLRASKVKVGKKEIKNQ